MAHTEREMELLRQTPSGNTLDPSTGNEIRRTDNGLKCGDVESPQHRRPLTDAEIAVQIAKAGEVNGDC